jgi:exopolysaccharide biosynthesis polyprenyl glycosylphosphotransferase
VSSDVGTGPIPAVRGRRTEQRPAPAQVEAAWPNWESRYTALVVASDVVLIILGTAVAALAGFGHDVPAPVPVPWSLATATTVLTVASFAVWRAWEPRYLGQGSEEFSRVLKGTVTSLVILGMVGLATQTESVRPWTFAVIPLIGLVVAAARYGLRRGLHRQRRKGCCVHHVLAVGTPQSVAELVVRTRDARHFGWVVTGACTANGKGFGEDDTIAGVPVVGDLEALPRVVGRDRYRVVAVTPTPDWSSRRLHRLAWDLEDTSAEIVVDPGLLEVAGPRLHVKPVDGLPLLRLTAPSFSGVARVVKGGFDRLSAVLLILLLLPVLLAVAVAVKLDGGPVFFRQTRVGQGGRVFGMIKFRSMVVDAEKLRTELDALNEGAGPLFKMRHDPRVTPVGRWLRRYSMDELPQLFNVLVGSMSLVGPRPPLPDEVLTYSREAHRRLLVRPGLTGLWQVNGRSNLSWEEAIRLDLRYVENWSLAMDALILWKTLGAVLKGDGAY